MIRILCGILLFYSAVGAIDSNEWIVAGLLAGAGTGLMLWGIEAVQRKHREYYDE